MNRISWNNLLNTGNPAMDVDHARLVHLFNKLAEAMDDRKGKAFCGNGLNKIIQVAKAHFQVEEELMARYEYPKIEYHATEHAMLLRQMLNYKAKFEARAAGTNLAFVHMPKDWLTGHIVTSDKELAEFVSRRIAGDEPRKKARKSAPKIAALPRK